MFQDEHPPYFYRDKVCIDNYRIFFSFADNYKTPNATKRDINYKISTIQIFIKYYFGVI